MISVSCYFYLFMAIAIATILNEQLALGYTLVANNNFGKDCDNATCDVDCFMSPQEAAGGFCLEGECVCVGKTRTIDGQGACKACSCREPCNLLHESNGLCMDGRCFCWGPPKARLFGIEGGNEERVRKNTETLANTFGCEHKECRSQCNAKNFATGVCDPDSGCICVEAEPLKSKQFAGDEECKIEFDDCDCEKKCTASPPPEAVFFGGVCQKVGGTTKCVCWSIKRM